MCLITFLLLYLQLLRFCYGGFIEFSDMNDNLASLWSNRVPFAPLVPSALQTKCAIPGEQTEGICKSKTQCLLSGGVPRGSCGLLSTCCAYGRTRTTSAKVSYFSSNDVQLTESPVSFHVIRMNSNVCQLRLDFIEFKLRPAVITGTAPALYRCSEDNFYVMPGAEIPPICGENTGQHIYINAINELQSLTLNVKFLPRTADLPRWNIKITQLQCPKITGKIVSIERGVAEDFLMIAPPGCLQYFIKESGNIRNLGYDGTNPYAAYQYYAICFRRTNFNCDINFVVRRFSIGGTAIPCLDYIMVPGLETVVDTENPNNKLCTSSNIANNAIIKSRTPGPLHIIFRSKNFAAVVGGNIPTGFDLDYTLEQCTSNYYV